MDELGETMTNWGYRVYTFEMREGKTALAQDLEGHRERLLETLRLVGERTRVGKPRLRRDTDENSLPEDEDPADYDRTSPTLSVRGVDYNRELHVVHVVVALGEHGLHDYATNPDDHNDRLDVENRTAETPMRVDFFMSTAQTKGFIVAETLGMRDAVPALTRWITYCSRKEREKRNREIEEQSQHFDSNGIEISKSKAIQLLPPRFKIKAERVADPELLKTVIDEMTSMNADFIQIDSNGKERKRTLSIKVDDATIRERIIRRFEKTDSDTDSIILDTFKDLDMDPEYLSKGNLEVNKIQAHIRSPQGSKTLTPGKFSDLFNYHFKADGRPRTAPYYQAILDKIDHLQTPAQVALKLPDEGDIIEWINREELSWEKQAQADAR